MNYKGDNSNHHKLTSVQVLEIRSDYKTQKHSSLARLANKYHVSRYCIWSIVNGRYWTHLA